METENYCNSIWLLIYDQSNQGRHQQELAFYGQELSSCTGSVLEVACGTGMILLPLLKQGLDIYGFDISSQMLDILFAKAQNENISDIEQRISQQNMVDFDYDIQFDAIFIPARSFLHLATQGDQIACLRNMHRHLRENGVLMLNFFTPELEFILENTKPNPPYLHLADFQHPEGKEKIKVSVRQSHQYG